MLLHTRIRNLDEYGKGQGERNRIFAEATITGRNNQDLIRRLKLTMTTMRMIVDDCVRIV